METNTHLEAIRGDLAALVGGDEQAEAVADRLGRALESSVHLRFLDAMGEAALELSSQLPGGRVEVRLSGRDIQLVYVDESGSAQAPPAPEEEGGTARLTLRLPEAMKARIEREAETDRLSVNAWLVRAIDRSLDRRTHRVRASNRITGFAQS